MAKVYMNITIEIFTGNDSEPYIETVSKLRIEAFKEYPYLYMGELDYERQYMRGYTKDDRAMIAIATCDGKLAGISTGIPLTSDSEIVSEAKIIFLNENIDIEDYYYYGELIILPEFKGKGILTKLLSAQDELIRSWGYKHACGLTVVREDNHPLKPAGYKSPYKIGERLGYKRTNIRTQFDWPTIQSDGRVKNEKNILEFWIKDLTI
jgi:GNAT superfamily N-acetyltransferase